MSNSTEINRFKDWILYRYDTLQEIPCSKCNKSKKSKLVAIQSPSNAVMCNGCFGQMMSENFGIKTENDPT